MKLVTAAQMRELDRLTIQEFGTPGIELMKRAGQAVVNSLEGHFEWVLADGRPIVVLAGKGNNGGDAFIAVHELIERGHEAVSVVMVADEDELQGDARAAFQIMEEHQPPILRLSGMKSLSTLEAELRASTLIIDGLLGTGTRGPVRGRMADIINVVNESRRLVLSIDIPSGLDGDEGRPLNVAVLATQVVTLALPKVGLVKNRGLDYSSHIDVADIGIPFYYIEEIEAPAEMIVREEVRELLPKRWNISHKGDYGHVVVLGGAAGYAGAPVLAGLGALRAGAGLVTVGVPASVYPIAAGMRPELMVAPLPDEGGGRLSPASLPEVQRLIERASACVIGPGMTTDPRAVEWLRRVLPLLRAPVILDADALNIVALHPELPGAVQAPLILTPHPGEMARLAKRPVADIQADRWSAVQDYLQARSANLILKGAGTLVSAPREAVWVNATGNPGMATAGMGDVLSGVVAGLVGQGLQPFDACRAGVFLHGLAGDYACYRESEQAMTASDVLDCMREAFNTTLA